MLMNYTKACNPYSGFSAPDNRTTATECAEKALFSGLPRHISHYGLGIKDGRKIDRCLGTGGMLSALPGKAASHPVRKHPGPGGPAKGPAENHGVQNNLARRTRQDPRSEKPTENSKEAGCMMMAASPTSKEERLFPAPKQYFRRASAQGHH